MISKSAVFTQIYLYKYNIIISFDLCSI